MLAHLVDAILNRIEDQKLTNLLSSLIGARRETDVTERRASLALLTAFAEDKRLLEPARQQMTQLYRESVDDKADEEEAAILFFANEGLRFLELFDLCPIGPRKVSTLTQHMIKRAEQVS